jgi:hypothetical protein
VAGRSVAATALPSFFVVAIIALCNSYEIELVSRIASAETVLWIACAVTANSVVYAAAVYMRAHREEPMLPVSVVTALLIFILNILCKDDVSSMMLGYAVICVCVSLPWTLLLFQRYLARHRL